MDAVKRVKCVYQVEILLLGGARDPQDTKAIMTAHFNCGCSQDHRLGKSEIRDAKTD